MLAGGPVDVLEGPRPDCRGGVDVTDAVPELADCHQIVSQPRLRESITRRVSDQGFLNVDRLAESRNTQIGPCGEAVYLADSMQQARHLSAIFHRARLLRQQTLKYPAAFAIVGFCALEAIQAIVLEHAQVAVGTGKVVGIIFVFRVFPHQVGPDRPARTNCLSASPKLPANIVPQPIWRWLSASS